MQQANQVAAASDQQRGSAQAAAAGARSDLLKIHQLIDLRDKPISLSSDDIGWSRVRAGASNCICCCANGSITLVTTDDSYILDHIPLDEIQAAQANSSLAYLALSNRNKIAIIDLVESSLQPRGSQASIKSAGSARLRNCTKVVNLASRGQSMADVLLWRWIDESVLGILTHEALYTCPVEQTRINHPAASALDRASQLLAIERVCDLHPNLSRLCQVTGIQRDDSTNLYAITGLYSSSLQTNDQTSIDTTTSSPPVKPVSVASHWLGSPSISPSPSSATSTSSPSLRHNFNSVPGRLSQLANNNNHLESSRQALDGRRMDLNHNQLPPQPEQEDEILGLVQIHCRMRNRSQLIRAQAATFASLPVDLDAHPKTTSTTLIAANRGDDKLRVHFIGMATSSDLTTSGQNSSPSFRLNPLADGNRFDFPTSIVCSTFEHSAGQLHVAMVTTKHGQLFVCSVSNGTILFNARITQSLISSTVLEQRTGGLMAICRDGKVLLVQLNAERLARLLEESRSIRHIPSYDLLIPQGRQTIDASIQNLSVECSRFERQISPESAPNADQGPLNMGLDVIESTRL